MTTVTQATTTKKRSLTGEPSRFHLSLNVGNLNKSIQFLQVLLGCEPAKCRPDYAKFELDDPPLVLSLEPCSEVIAGNLNHLGFRVESSNALIEVQRRLELSGISTVREEGVECCYARQTKFWVHDPDGNMWEIYTLDEDIEHRGHGSLPTIQPGEISADSIDPAASVWNHRLGQKLPAKLAIQDQSVDFVVLEGTLNQRWSESERSRLVSEFYRILKPNGQLRMHMLTADRPICDEALKLPGAASGVKSVPTVTTVVDWLRAANFSNSEIVFLAETACFRADDAELRETRIRADRT